MSVGNEANQKKDLHKNRAINRSWKLIAKGSIFQQI
jgi:hypothetical protein